MRSCSSDCVPRNSRASLTAAEVAKLETEGINCDHHDSDLAIMRARYDRDTIEKSLVGVRSGELSCEEVLKEISHTMSNTKSIGGISTL